MKVQDIMTSDVQCCGPDTNLAAAAKMMWDSDCGALPVLNVQGQVMSMITDRDICMAAATKNEAPRSKLRGILRNSPKPLPSFAKATEGSPRLHPRSSLLRRSSRFGCEGRKLRGIRRRRINRRGTSPSGKQCPERPTPATCPMMSITPWTS